MRVGIISQARMTSTRLPGKVLREAGGQPLLAWHVQRLRAAGAPLYLAITTNSADDVLAEFAAAHGLPCTRGDEHDVLARYQQCAAAHELDVVVRVTSDCPLIAPELIAAGIQRYLAAADDQLYLSNALERTYPRGFDFEIFSSKMLAEAAAHATRPEDREHVTPFLHQNRADNVRFSHFRRPTDASRYRLTVDTAADFELLRQLLDDYDAGHMTAEELISLLDTHPELVAINARVEQKKL
ncbi:cytidylyltransferase domain-containing protein [Hymenobacter coccineus]|uniref:Acylneuraminate cytidylyltransferase n=1 Tax=Hymenobacter coccineus TaxID=1908235 RepID=A0A1G1TIF9_9BACT|nr:glycosyltransferase family protein [Hymenobacter coccineus]OGX90638.1 acylneuraminate cytidylyltransferase [Hymenobacter coccineus]